MKEKKRYQIIILVLILILAVILTKKEIQNDVFYSISVGKDILQKGIDFKDHYSFIEGLSYTYPHWLFDVVLYGLYAFLSFDGIYFFTIFLYMILGVSLFFVYQKKTKNLFFSSLFSICAMFVLQSFITSRAQSITYLCFLFEIYFIYQLLETNKRKYQIGLLLIAILIANVHIAMFPMYFVFYLPFFVEEIVAHWKKRDFFFSEKIMIQKEKNQKSLLQVFFLSFFCGFITPLKWYPYTYFFQTILGNSVKIIAEHQPLNIKENPGFYLLFGFISIFFMLTKSKIRLSSLCLFFGLSLLTLLSRRSYALFIVLGMIPMIEILSSFLEEKDKTSCDQVISLLMHHKISLILVVFLLGGAFLRNSFSSNYFDNKKYPIKASEYIKENLDFKAIHLWNGYNYGSYLLYQGIPVFIDSRADLYTKEFNQKDILGDYQKVLTNEQEIFEKYQITHILIDKEESLYYVLRSQNLKSLYEDETFILYEYTF